jgi:two-component system invasion response regulator UvrY
MEKITLLIVDDHKLIRETWSFILNRSPLLEVIAECSSGEEAIAYARNLRPDIIIMDISLPGMNGFEATRQIRKFSPGSKVLGVSLHTQPTYARQMMQNGAMGYVTKNSPKEELFHAISEAHAGRKYICREIKNILSEQMMDANATPQKGINALSMREMEIISFIKKGYSSKEIAVALSVSLKTVEVHRYNILKKLNLKNAAALVHFINQNCKGQD